MSQSYKRLRLIYIRRFILLLFCGIFVLCLVVFSEKALSSAVRGITLWFNIVFPSLFPFFVVSEMLNGTGFTKAAGILFEPLMRPIFNVPGCSSFALLMGLTSGYPVGAKITCDLREKGYINKTEAERLLAFTNNSSPLFITGAVGTGIYGMPSLGLLLLVCHVLAGITVGVLFRFYKRVESSGTLPNSKQIFFKFKNELKRQSRIKINLGLLFGEAVKNSISLVLAIGGFIILFSVIIGLLTESGIISGFSSFLAVVLSPLNIDSGIINSIISGFFEITTGVNIASSSISTPFELKLAATSLILGWAGLSVHSQVLSLTSKTDISIKPYLLGKMLQGIFAALYTCIAIRFFSFSSLVAHPVFDTAIPKRFTGWLHILPVSGRYLVYALCIYGLLCLFTACIYFYRRSKTR